ncbi:MAG: polyhydroxyalkanoic acid system family protein [Sediminibacterium sp.]
MAHFDMSIPHQLTQEEALKKIQGLLSEAKKDHGDKISNLQENWNDNVGAFSFTIMGFDISGTLTVKPSTIDLEAELPFAASLFKGKIKDLISEKAGELLKSQPSTR